MQNNNFNLSEIGTNILPKKCSWVGRSPLCQFPSLIQKRHEFFRKKS